MTIKIRLERATDEYCSHMEARGLAVGTIRSRRSTLGIFRRHVGNVYVETLNHRHVDLVFSAEPWSERTRNLKLSQLRTFFEWCRNRRYLGRDTDPTFGWRMLSPQDPPRNRIPASEWPRLFQACLHPTETIAVATGLFLFLRGSEQQHLQMKHIDLDAGTVAVFRKKTREWDEMPVSTELDRHLRAYLTWYSEQVAIHPDHYVLAPRVRGTYDRDPDTRRILPGTGAIDPLKAHAKPHLIVQRVLARAGYVIEGEGEHTLRRSGARAYFDVLAERGYDGALRRVQAMLGHKSSLVTETYLGLDLDRRARNADIIGNEMFPGLVVDGDPTLREVTGG